MLKLTIALRCAAQATSQDPEPVAFQIYNSSVTDFTDRAWSYYTSEQDRKEFKFEWESDDSDGYRAHYGFISYDSHPEAFLGTDSRGEEYVRGFIKIPAVVEGKSPLEVAKDAARKGIPMKWTLSYPGFRNHWARLYTVVDWNSIIGACGRTDFVGGADRSLSPSQISNARYHIQQASEALGLSEE